LNGPYEFPHLIVPVDSANPSKAYGTSYNGTINPSVSSIFNFDIPASYAGKTCSLVFLFPELSQLETSSYSFNNQGGLAISGLVSPATEQTTFDSIPASNGQVGSIGSVVPGNGYSILTQECPAGQRVSFKFSSVGGLDVNFFQDYNPSPLGVYVTVC
jgi:glucan endo-1,3-beta-D-glucosidase